MVPVIGNVEGADSVHRYTSGAVKLCGDGRSVVPAEAPLSDPGYGGDVAKGIHPANTVVPRIGDIEVTDSIYCQL